MSFWLFGKKKGEKKMDEQVRNTSNQQINDEGTSQIFQGFELEYAALKQAITRELSDYRDMLTRERNQLNVYKNKVQTRDVMEELLPVLSDIKNDVLDSTNLDDLKKTIIIRFKQLKTALKKVGIELQAHERNQPIDSNEKINASNTKPTGDPKLHQYVACSVKMGCIIKGEEDNPIFEDIELFKYEKQAAPNNGYSARDGGSRPPISVQQPQQQQFYSGDDKSASYQQPQRREEPTGSPIRKPDYTVIGGNAIRFEKTLFLQSHHGNIQLLRERATLVVSNTWQRFNINIPCSCIREKEELYVYLGSELINNHLELHGVDLFYALVFDKVKNNPVLILGERNSLDQPVQELIQIDLIN